MGLKEIRSEIDEMEKVFNEFEPAGDQATNPPATNPPETIPPATQSPATDAPATSPPATDPPSDEPDERDKEIEALRAKIAEYETKPKPKPKPSTEAPSTEAPLGDEDFVGDLDLDDLTRDPKLFNQVLNKVYKRGVDIGRSEVRKGSELMLKSIPDIVKNNIALNATLKAVNEEFYSSNPDLVPFKKVVGAVFEEVISENPDKTYRDVLPQVAEETRKRLELHKKATPAPKPTNPPPLPRKKGGPRQQSQPNTDPLLAELEAMDKVLDY